MHISIRVCIVASIVMGITIGGYSLIFSDRNYSDIQVAATAEEETSPEF